MRLRSCLSVLLTSVIAASVQLPVLAENEAALNQAIADYNARQYEQARIGLEACLKEGSSRPDGFYYLALTYQQLGRLAGAREAYAFVVKNFPGTTAATMSKKAMDQLSAALTSGPATLPRETWVPFTRRGTSMIVDARVNNKPMKMIFDTGAEGCAFSLAHFRQLGLPIPSGPPTAFAQGVGKSEPIPEWQVKIDLVVGRIERKQFLVSVGENGMSLPLLGQDFFTGMEYSIDSSNNVISFKKREAAPGKTMTAVSVRPGMTVDASGKYVYVVPFEQLGECASVKVTVNNKVIPMIFDTGAEVTMFTTSQAASVGIPPGGRTVQIGGIGGAVAATLGVVDSIKLGPIERRAMRVPVTDKTAISQSLLGQDFLRGWHYTIDKQNKVIRFTRATGANNY